MFDSLSFEELKKISIGTTNGMVFSLIAGSIASISLITINDLSNKKRSIYIFSTTFLFIACVLTLLLSFQTLSMKLAEIRSDVFLIVEQDGFYQRSAAFMFMLFLLLSTWFISLFLVENKSTKFTSTVLFLAFMSLTGVAVALMLTSQLIGSNAGLVTVGAFWMVLLTHIIVYRMDKNILNKLTYLKIKSLLFSRVSLHVLAIVLLGFIFTISLLGYALDAAGIDIETFRIVGFGDGNISSVDSRLELLMANFLTHFLYSPFFGNSMVDTLTTGPGTYVHSSISVLTHYGILGFTLFLLFLYFSYRDVTRSNSVAFKNNMTAHKGYKLYQLFAFFSVGMFGLFSSFFTWMPFWFCIGLCVISFKVKS
ncbi:hypothetical protein KJ365_07370 [Glaciecola sp. XM2]|uniref:hypothetical protein n=1 Tax=Glaciecola sp. XM2 TaxID=1914931 RepID=UPI001BDDFE21|nr:hypothetical protein [Glaciecola sp. XM2]MBT1450700.1 hypothetical protein [Glaciecola sp. XM2]